MPVVAPCRLLAAVALAAGTLFGTAAAAADWYVAANGKGAKGTKDKPFKAIVKALEKANSGDVIHVAQGEYTGKKKAGYIVIEKAGLTLVGGYKDKDFAERDPFAYPTVITEKGKAKGEAVGGAYVRIVLEGTRTDHRSTTIDGFWFDRKGQNHYDKLQNLMVGPETNLTPMIDFRDKDCHIRNNVFLNSAAVAVRIAGDGSSVVNNLFVNSNGAAVFIRGEGEKTADDHEFNRIVVKNNTFVGLWNCCGLERGDGAGVVLDGGAEVQVTDNIFHLSAGNRHSMGWAVRSERNFDNYPWLHFDRNSTSQLRGGILRYFDAEQTTTVGVTTPEGLAQSNTVAPAENDATDPLFEHDKGWLAVYSAALPPGDASEKNVDVEQLKQLRQRHGLPVDGSDYAEGAGLAAPYPLAHVKTGALFRIAAEAIAARGAQASGSFAIVAGALIASAGTPPSGDAAESATAQGAGGSAGTGDAGEASAQTTASKEDPPSEHNGSDSGGEAAANKEGGADAAGEPTAGAASAAGEESAAKDDEDKAGDGAAASGDDGASAEGEANASDSDDDKGGDAPAADSDYAAVEWAKVWSDGESMVDARIALTAYWTKWDSAFTAGKGKKAKEFVEGANRKSHKILALRQVPKAKAPAFLKGFVPVGSPALDYIKKKAKKKCPPKGRCKLSFVVRGVIKKAGGKIGKKSPQIIIAVDQISEK